MSKKNVIIGVLSLIIIIGVVFTITTISNSKSEKNAIALVKEMREEGTDIEYVEEERIIRLTSLISRDLFYQDSVSHMELEKITRRMILARMKAKDIKGIDCEILVLDRANKNLLARLNEEGTYRK